MATNNDQYNSIYSSAIDELIGKALNREAFQYDPATDAAYQSYARQYARLGDEAARDTLADVSAQTGGLASSYAATASQQARNTYNQALTDKIPSLMEAAYQKYRNEQNDLYANINMLQGLDTAAYNRWASDRDYQRGIYESDRDYNERLRQYNAESEYQRMLNIWNTLGYASKEVAKYFGVPEGTKTDDAKYREAELALERARLNP